jgi:hypothetical protein
MASLIDQLLQSDEPSIRLQIRLGAQDADEAEASGLRQQVRSSARVVTLLSERGPDGLIDAHPYRAKWYGAHWVLVILAELGYPSGDSTIIPLREQMLGWLFSSDYLNSLGRVRGLPRLHGSIEGNALWAMLRLGLADERADQLVERLRQAQWPDGGWNCDRKASGTSSSFTESLIPLRALSLHASMRSDRNSAEAAGAAAEFFLSHRLYVCGCGTAASSIHRSSNCTIPATGITTSCSHLPCWPSPGVSATTVAAQRLTCWRASGCLTAASRPSTATTGPPGPWSPTSVRSLTGEGSAGAG